MFAIVPPGYQGSSELVDTGTTRYAASLAHHLPAPRKREDRETCDGEHQSLPPSGGDPIAGWVSWERQGADLLFGAGAAEEG